MSVRVSNRECGAFLRMLAGRYVWIDTAGDEAEGERLRRVAANLRFCASRLEATEPIEDTIMRLLEPREDGEAPGG